MAQWQSLHECLNHRYREQAPSHIFCPWSGSGLRGPEAFDGAVNRGFGDFQQMPHCQNLRPLRFLQQLPAIQRRRRSAVQQTGGVEQGVFEAQVFVDGVETLGGQVMVDGAVEGSAVFGGIDGWVG